MSAKESEIVFKIKLDENKMPEDITWQASDSGEPEPHTCKAVLLSMWDKNENNTLRIDLWTKDMMVDEMKLLFHQTLVSMTDTFERATGEKKIVGDMRDFCEYFAEKMELYKKD